MLANNIPKNPLFWLTFHSGSISSEFSCRSSPLPYQTVGLQPKSPKHLDELLSLNPGRKKEPRPSTSSFTTAKLNHQSRSLLDNNLTGMNLRCANAMSLIPICRLLTATRAHPHITPSQPPTIKIQLLGLMITLDIALPTVRRLFAELFMPFSQCIVNEIRIRQVELHFLCVTASVCSAGLLKSLFAGDIVHSRRVGGVGVWERRRFKLFGEAVSSLVVR